MVSVASKRFRSSYFSCSVRKESELQEGYSVGQKIWSLQKSETWEKEENQSYIYIKIWHHMTVILYHSCVKLTQKNVL